jgi:pimeloyl-ACP methyl ester carboxylesterase
MPKAVSRSEDVAFMIAVSCPGMDSVEQSAYLVEKQVLCEGYGEEAGKKAGRAYRQRARAQTYREYLEAAEFLARDPVVSGMNWGGVMSEAEFTPRPPSHQMFFNPVTLLQKIKIPVLAIFGENDTQIDPRQGAEAYQSALEKAGNPFFRIALFPGANHGILLSETGCMKDWGRNRGYAPGYLDLMIEWLGSLLERWKSER